MSYKIPDLPLSFEIESKVVLKQGLMSNLLAGKVRVGVNA